MQSTRRAFLMGTGSTLAAAALPARAWAQQSGADAAAQRLIDQVAEQYLAVYPESATYLGIDRGTRAALKSRLTDRSPEGQEAIQHQLAGTLAEIDAIDIDALGPDMKINVDVVKTSYGLGLDGMRFPYGDVSVGGWRNSPYVVIQNVGAYLDVPRMLDSDHQIETAADAEAYLARLESYARQLDGETERLRAAAAMGVIAPDFLLDKALRQLDLARSGNPAQWGVVESIERRTDAMSGDYAAAAAVIAATQVKPALNRQFAELQSHRGRANSNAGVWDLPQGDEYYAWTLRAATTTDMTPDEVHAMGREELAQLHAEMDTILKSLGYTRGTVGERMIGLGNDPRFLFPDNDEGRQQILEMLRARIADMHGRMPQAFNTLVRGNVEVKRLPPEEEPGAPGAYGGAGTIDGSVPGRFWINLHTTRLHTKYSLPTLAYHESIPGHAWQGEYAFRLPLIRSLLSFNAYSEGWALYAEQLANELGVYDEDPVGRLGYLQSIAFRACRLVVDTGLHAKRWSREQAIQWFHETNGSGIDEVTSEVERYCSWPGQACGYKVGHSEINRLRAHAQAAMGDRYAFKDFNDAVVTSGNVPMTVLGRVVERYIGG
ncbi:DUF885 domain-containing protein [Sphingosinithalassobacter sp. CS137]|uniref:DUF885 domain-containing protein n=1 Tax=Sphingosinithalassobacter sp. CS137 TaxID=2762748 RepID=UPI00165E587E|nr:DUF885 domain-containing protein [Sphingosinithalassobacter sp. CS137]